MDFDLSLESDFEIKIGPHTWSVLFVELVPAFATEEHTWGACCAEKQTIYINSEASYSMKLSTFFHELVHAFESIYEVQLAHRDLNLIGDALAQVLLDSFQKKSSKKK